MISRRHLMLAAGGAALFAPSLARAETAKPFGGPALAEGIAALDAKSGGRLGVAVLETGTGARFGHRANERFPMCSTFKFLLAAQVLAHVDQGRASLDTVLPVTQADVIDYSAELEKYVGKGASVAALCGAAVMVSDNGAANLLLRTFGGPAAVTQFARSIGDPVTRLDRNEPELNEVPPGEDLDTTTPDAMAADLARLVLGNTLPDGPRAMLTSWLVECGTGRARLRAGLPQDWKAGDKTGTGFARTGSYNDIAVLWPPGRAPLVVTSYLTASKVGPKASDAIHAEVGRLVAAAVGG